MLRGIPEKGGVTLYYEEMKDEDLVKNGSSINLHNLEEAKALGCI